MDSVIPILVPTISNVLSFQYVLPFILFLAVTFSILESKNILSKRKPVNALVSFIITLMAMMSPIGPSLMLFFSTFSAKIGVYLVSLMFGLMVIMIVYDAAAKTRGRIADHSKLLRWVFRISIVAVLFMFITSGGFQLLGLKLVIPTWLTGDLIVYVGVFGFIITFFTFISYMGSSEQRHKRKIEEESDIRYAEEHEKRMKRARR